MVVIAMSLNAYNVVLLRNGFRGVPKEIEEAIKSVDNRDCYLKLIDEVIVFENEVVIVDNFGTDISKEDFSQIAPQLIKMEPVLYGFFTSSYSRKVIKYRLIRLGGSKWK